MLKLNFITTMSNELFTHSLDDGNKYKRAMRTVFLAHAHFISFREQIIGIKKKKKRGMRNKFCWYNYYTC